MSFFSKHGTSVINTTKRRGPVEALAKELYEAGLTAVDNGFIAWDDIPAPMKFCWMAVAEHVEQKFERRVPAPPHRQSCPYPECVKCQHEYVGAPPQCVHCGGYPTRG